MRIRPDEKQRLAQIFEDELRAARHRVSERLAQLEARPAGGSEDSLAGIRRFYEDLADAPWTEADERALDVVKHLEEGEIKKCMREGFLRLRVHPVPSFVSLLNAAKRNSDEPKFADYRALGNHDAVPAVERERIANVLHRELDAAVRLLALHLKLGDTKLEVVREHLESVEGAVISEFTPLVG